MPTIDKPGIYVWGDPDQHWHITVAGDASWPSPRKFKVILESPGKFENRAITGAANEPVVRSTRLLTTLTWEGTVGSSWVDLRFDLSGSTHMQLTLYLDVDGDGDPKPSSAREAAELVYLRKCKVHPEQNPFVISRDPPGMSLVPNVDFRVGRCFGGTYPYCASILGVPIEELERRAGCR
jgi:hypothetical protein